MPYGVNILLASMVKSSFKMGSATPCNEGPLILISISCGAGCFSVLLLTAHFVDAHWPVLITDHW